MTPGDSGMPKPFQYKITGKHKPKDTIRRLAQIRMLADPLPLTGYVAGKRATDIEERFARGLQSAGFEFRFQVRFTTINSLPWQEKEVDFVVEVSGLMQPVEVDGQIGHRTSAQRGRDAIREVLLNETFFRLGYLPLIRVGWYELETQEMANGLVRRTFREG